MQQPELELIYQTAPVGLAVLDVDFRFVRINERLARMNGLSVAEHLGRTVREVVPAVAEQAEALLGTVLREARAIRDIEIRGETPADPGVERIWVEQFHPILADDGRAVGVSVVAEEVTERRRAEEALRRSEANVAFALEAGGLVAWDWDVRSGEVAANFDWLAELGYAPGHFASMTEAWRALTHPEDRPVIERTLGTYLEGRTPIYECAYRMRAADGEWRWFHSRGRVAERDAAGRPTRLIGVRRDVTDERRTQDDLHERALLLDLAFDAIFVWSDDGGIERWNRGAELQYGYSAEEAFGQSSHTLLKTRFPESLDAIEASLRSQGVWRGELIHTCRDGRELTVQAVMQMIAIPHREGAPRVLEINRDITAAKQAQAVLAEQTRALRRSQQTLDVALEVGRMGVWDWEPVAGRTVWSPHVYRMAGLDPSTAGNADVDAIMAIVHPEDRPQIDAEMARVLGTGGDLQVEFRLLQPDGRPRWLVSRGRVVHGASGTGSRIIGVTIDITDRKLIEQDLRDADARRTEFLAMLAHELRNPLAPISNCVRLLERVGDQTDRREAATQILRRQTAHMARLVDDLLEASRITQGRIELRMENVLVAASVLQAVETARPRAQQRRQSLHVDVPSTLDVVADPARLTQVIANLVANAVKYTQDGGNIWVSAAAEGAQGNWLRIEVRDDGPGIRDSLLPHIFDLFTQDRRTLDRSEGGLGIGLALVKRLTELHGGHVSCRSLGAGLGASFVVSLPRADRREQARGLAYVPAHPTLLPMSMLVVDDNQDAAETLAEALRLDGHRVEVAYDGEAALRQADAGRHRVIVLDLGLPKVDGLEVARRLRARSEFRHTVIVAVSGYAQAADRDATAEAGFDGHLAKPVEIDQLYRVLAKRTADLPSPVSSH